MPKSVVSVVDIKIFHQNSKVTFYQLKWNNLVIFSFYLLLVVDTIEGDNLSGISHQLCVIFFYNPSSFPNFFGGVTTTFIFGELLVNSTATCLYAMYS